MCKNDHGSYCRGFTLLEVIIALGIVVVGILAVSRAVTGYIETTATLEQRMIANWVASNRLEMLRIQKTVPEPGTSKGTEEMAGRTWHFRETIANTADPYLFRVDIVVFADKDETEEAGALYGYLLNEAALTQTQSDLRAIIIPDKAVVSRWASNIAGANEFAPANAEIASSYAPRNDGFSLLLSAPTNDGSFAVPPFSHSDGSFAVLPILNSDGLLVSMDEV